MSRKILVYILQTEFSTLNFIVTCVSIDSVIVRPRVVGNFGMVQISRFRGWAGYRESCDCDE